MNRTSYLYILLIGIILSGCKPTEKGYKSAYDAALGKRQAAMADVDVNLQGGLQEVDGAQLKEIDGVQVYVMNKRLQPVDIASLPGSYNVAVGTYKMSTNCKSQVEDLKNQGYSAIGAKDTEGMYFSIAGSFETMKEAVKLYQTLQKNKNRIYVGLPSAPVVIFSPK